MQLLKEKAAGTDNKLSFQEYTRYIPVYTWYTKYRNVDKRLDPTATLAHLPFIVALPYVSGYHLHLPVFPPFFAEMYTL